MLSRLKKKYVAKLVCGLGLLVLTAYFITNGLYIEDKTLPRDGESV